MPELPRGTVTFLFTDIEGSTTLLRCLGDVYGEAVHEHRRRLAEAVADEGGIVYGVLGDEVSAVFRTAADAVAAATAAQRSLCEATWPERTVLRVRMGVHTGSALVGPDEYIGLDVHRTARICAAGHGGQVLVSAVAVDALGDAVPIGVTVRDLGEHTLKDIPDPERLFQLVIAGVRNEFPALRVVGADDARAARLSRARGLAASLREAVTALQRRAYESQLDHDEVPPREPFVSPYASAFDDWARRHGGA